MKNILNFYFIYDSTFRRFCFTDVQIIYKLNIIFTEWLYFIDYLTYCHNFLSKSTQCIQNTKDETSLKKYNSCVCSSFKYHPFIQKLICVSSVNEHYCYLYCTPLPVFMHNMTIYIW